MNTSLRCLSSKGPGSWKFVGDRSFEAGSNGETNPVLNSLIHRDLACILLSNLQLESLIALGLKAATLSRRGRIFASQPHSRNSTETHEKHDENERHFRKTQAVDG
jgi:hypothetical protein